MTNEIRNSNGQFSKGNPGGPGNPYARRVARVRTLILETVTDDDIRAIIQAQVKKAREGDQAASREVLTRVAGKPPVGSDPDRLDIEQINLETETAKAVDEQSLPPEMRSTPRRR